MAGPSEGTYRARLLVRSVVRSLNAAGAVESEQVTLVVDPSNPDGDNSAWFAGAGQNAGLAIMVTNPTMIGTFVVGASVTLDATPTAGPTITSITPAMGGVAGGTAVTIVGTGFRDGIRVGLGGVAASSVVVVSDTEITAITPASNLGAVAVDVTLSYFPDFAAGISLVAAFTYQLQSVTGITPNTGPDTGGTAVTIEGTGFRSGIYVLIGAAFATNIVVVSDTELTAVTPPNPLSGSSDVAVDVELGYTPSMADAVTLAGGFTCSAP